MYHDRNPYINNQHCEYCGEEFIKFEKIIFPLNCKNNTLAKSNISHSLHSSGNKLQNSPGLHGLIDSHTQKKLNWDEPLKIRKDLDRPHYYHVICYDTIIEKINKKNVTENKKQKFNKKKADRAVFCHEC